MISPIILAMDTDDLDIAKRWISLTNGSVGVYKLGLEFFLKFGPDGIVEIQNETEREQVRIALEYEKNKADIERSLAKIEGIKEIF